MNIYNNNISAHKLFGLLILNLSLLGVSTSMYQLPQGTSELRYDDLIFLLFEITGVIISIFFILKKEWARRTLSLFFHITSLSIIIYYLYELPNQGNSFRILFLSSFSAFLLINSLVSIIFLQSATIKNEFK